MHTQDSPKKINYESIPRMTLDDGVYARGLDQANRSYHQFQADILSLAQIVDISHPEKFPRHPGLLGGCKQWLKSRGSKLFSPLIRLYLFKQVKVNQIVLNLAMKVAALEARVKELEDQVNGTNRREDVV